MLALSCSLSAARARADLGDDISRLTRALSQQTRVEVTKPRLLERGDQLPVVLPPWALDDKRGECTTVVLVAPPATQFVVQMHPWPNLPSALASSAGALQVTRCGKDRVSFLQFVLELRSPRAVVHTLVSVGSGAVPALATTLPERDAGSTALPGDPGRSPTRAPLAERVARFASQNQLAGATKVDTSLLPQPGYVRLTLEPGCHRLLATAPNGSPSFALLLREDAAGAQDRRLEAGENGDVTYELCTALPRRVSVAVDAEPSTVERKLSVARFALPLGLPGRFGPDMGERLVQALGGAKAPKRLGPLVTTTLGAQGHTVLPRSFLPHTCYLSTVVVAHGTPVALTLAAQTGSRVSEASLSEQQRTPRISFCTGARSEAQLDVEARGLGLAWQLFVFQMGPARPEEP